MALSLPSAAAWAQKIPETPSIQMEPAGNWTVEYTDWKCLLHRDFTTAGKRTLFSLSREPLTSTAWMRIAIEGEGGKPDTGDEVMVVDGNRRAGTLHYNVFGVEGFRMREFMLDVAKHDLGSAQERIRFWTRKHGDVEVLAIGSQAAWKALGECMSDLYEEFGIDLALVAQMAKEPGGNVLSFVTFPRGNAFDVALLYWVTEAGRVDECRLLQPSGFESFDQSLCSDLKAKARFKPATNAAGQPMRVPRFDNIRIRTASFITTETLPQSQEADAHFRPIADIRNC